MINDIDNKVKEVADYIIATKSSTRKTAEHFHISNYTVHNYMTVRLKKIDNEKYKLVKEILNLNKPKTVKDDEVINRINFLIKSLHEGLSIVEIAKVLEVNPSQLYKDIQLRLHIIPGMTDEKLKEIKTLLEQNKKDNLSIGSNMTTEGQKRSNGRFSK